MRPTYRLSQQYAKDKRLNEKIWAERPHICAECGMGLQDPPKKHYFAHILSKGAFPGLRHRQDNIILLCFKCHYRYDNGMRQRMNIWEHCKEKITELKQAYYRKNP